MSGPDLVERLLKIEEAYTNELAPLARESIREAAAAISTLREQASHMAAMSNRDALAALKLESERDALRSRCETAEASRDNWKAVPGRVVEGFMEVCEAVGVQFDAPEAVAYAINAKIHNAEAARDAAMAALERCADAVRSVDLYDGDRLKNSDPRQTCADAICALTPHTHGAGQ